jgi:mannose-6-phosphate isomerase
MHLEKRDSITMTQNAPTAMNLYPLKFDPIYLPKVWGGRSLERLGRALPGDEHTLIGESWELADLDQTSPTGAGGQPAHSVVANGPLAGQTLRQLIGRFNSELTGALPLHDGRAFPLLIKFLDARQNLSLQVHPSPDYAARNPEVSLKTEGWYVIDAQPGAAIYKGFKPGVDTGQLRQALIDGSVVDLLNRIPVEAGDFHFLPSGTCHALGGGILVAEIQTPSDTTFRVYDWGRSDRELHIEEALACIDFGSSDTVPDETPQSDALFRCDQFTLHHLRNEPGQSLDRPADCLAIWIVLEGGGRLHTPSPELEDVEIQIGQSLLLPATMPYDQATFDQPTSILQITVE